MYTNNLLTIIDHQMFLLEDLNRKHPFKTRLQHRYEILLEDHEQLKERPYLRKLKKLESRIITFNQALLDQIYPGKKAA